MKKSNIRWHSFLTSALTLWGVSSASAGVVLNFTDLTTGTDITRSSYTDPTGAFVLTNSSSVNNYFTVWGSGSIYNADPGSATLTTSVSGTTTTLKSTTANKAFEFNSIDLADGFDNRLQNFAVKDVFFTFTAEGGSTSTKTLSLDSLAGLEDFSFNLGFKVIQVDWTALIVSGVDQYLQFDNIALDGGIPPAAVPEPASLALVGLALGGLGFCRRRGGANA